MTDARHLLPLICLVFLSLPIFSQQLTLDSLIKEIPTLSEQNYQQHLLLLYQNLSEQKKEDLLSITNKVMKAADKSPLPAVRIHTNIQVAKCLNSKNIDEGIDITLQIYWEAKSKQLPLETAEAAKLLASIYNTAADNEKTLFYTLEAFNIYRKLGTKEKITQFSYEMASIQYRAGNYQNTLEYLLKMDTQDIEILNSQEQINYYNTVALSYKKLKNYSKAFEYSEKALQKAKQYQKEEWVGILLGNKGDIFFEQNQLDSARHYWQIDLTLSEKYKIWGNLAATKNFIAKSYEQQANYPQAYKNYKDACYYLQKASHPEYENKMNTFYGMARTLAKLDSFQRAYEYIQKAYWAADSFQKAKQIQELSRIEFDFTIKDKETKRIFRQKEDERAAFAVRLLIFFLVAILCLLAYFLWKQYRSNKFIKMQNVEIERKSSQIERQNQELLEKQEEILQQKDIILQTNNEQEKLIKRLKHKEELLNEMLDKLIADEAIINEKNTQLEGYSKNLELEVANRTKEITEKNQELIKTVNQLEQFSYVLAHNVRAPIARLQGLIFCLDRKNLSNPENSPIIQFIEQSAHELDNIIKDLNKVLQIKKGVDEVYEKVDLEEHIERQRLLLFEAKAELYTDLKVRYVYAIKAYTYSILYNLVSNAIKYKHPNRQLVVSIKSYQDEKNLYIEVKDNGIGIDLTSYKDKIFGIYKRFHTGIEGKGLGLHIVKLQVEAMGGKIEVDSKVEEGTTFKMTFKKSEDVLQKLAQT